MLHQSIPSSLVKLHYKHCKMSASAAVTPVNSKCLEAITGELYGILKQMLLHLSLQENGMGIPSHHLKQLPRSCSGPAVDPKMFSIEACSAASGWFKLKRPHHRRSLAQALLLNGINILNVISQATPIGLRSLSSAYISR